MPRLIILVMGAAPIFLAGAVYDPLAAVGVLYLIVVGLLVAADLAFGRPAPLVTSYPAAPSDPFRT